ncbi:hypothetical protein LCDVSa091R [Lymphocystis disease virus 3]|uniref:Uncharacterized protein n=1 Tax=Lymphocystis disease virus 3 TaxID=2560566 RepID=A0A1B2RW07_9VIRU|nr:hypothetical protein BZK12_gp091 [Lymphocystis disease virus Sa]AOC55175.1 hypothetical protein LCDVSa091R [Lymphocystis disease virus 3]
MCEEFRIDPYKIASNKKIYSELTEKCGQPYPELSLKEKLTVKFIPSEKEYYVNKNILGLYDDSDRPKNYYPSYFLTDFKSPYNPALNDVEEIRKKEKKKYKSLIDLNLKPRIKSFVETKTLAPKESTVIYPGTDSLKYHPLTQIPERYEPEGFLKSWVDYLWGNSEESLNNVLQFSKPNKADLKRLFTEKPYRLFERRRKSLLIRQKLKTLTVDLCLKNIEEEDFKFDRVETKDSPYVIEIHTMINDAMNRSFIPNGRYSSGSVVCQGSIVHLQEKLDGNLTDRFTGMSLVEKDVTLCQLLLTLTILQGQYGILHNKISAKNIAFLDIKQSKGYFKYKIAGRTFYLPNVGFLAMFVGFDDARILNPMYGVDQYRGIRNVKVSAEVEPFWGNKAGNELIVKSFKTKYLPILDEKYDYKTYERNKSDQNIFIDGFDSTPDITVDLSDMRTYPAFDFKKDVEDLVKIFFPNRNYVFDGLRAILPDLTAAVLFPQFSELKFNVIEEFRWPSHINF